jgi:[FeFe] hydrogenase (group B1/B3)
MALSNTTRIKRDILIRLVQGFLKGTLLDDIDRIPLIMRPKEDEPTRCCIYKDRAIIKYRIMAALGVRTEDETDELKMLKEYCKDALKEDKPESPFLTILAEACSSCTPKRHEVTNACRKCAARLCESVCPKDAIYYDEKQAHIDKDKCINCGMCMKACPFTAIIRVAPPCEEACPVDAIKKLKNGKAEIDTDACILCGKCVTGCPFSAVMERSQIISVLNKLSNPRNHMTALVAPALYGQFTAPPEQVLAAVKKLGFDSVIDVSAGAVTTVEEESQELVERLDQKASFMTTSCCPSYVMFANKYMPDLVPHVSHTPSPMIFSARAALKANPNTTTVFIGPCIAKKQEALSSGIVHHVLNFEELIAMWAGYSIEIDDCSSLDLSGITADSREFPISGGVAKAVEHQCPQSIKTGCVNGLVNIKQFAKEIKQHKADDVDLIEVMVCNDGCTGGPAALSPAKTASARIRKNSKDKS